MKPINVLSLFGGIECWMIALKKLWIPVNAYFSSEINKFPMKVSTANFPEIFHIGDVEKISYEDGYLHSKIDETYFRTWEIGIDLLLGGPPCQNHSIAGNRKWLEGETGGMVLEYLRIFHEVKPKWFIMENVPGMKQDVQDIISASLGVKPRLINSAITWPQNRRRLYWSNIPGYVEPEDRGIVLRDILEDIPLEDPRWKPLPEKYREQAEKSMSKFGIFQIGRGNNSGGMKGDGKIPTVSASEWQHNNLLVAQSHMSGFRIHADQERVCTITATSHTPVLIGQFRRSNLRIHADQDKVCTLMANMGTWWNNVPIVIAPEKSLTINASYAKASIANIKKSGHQVILGMAHRNRGNGKEPEFNGTEKANALTTVRSDSEILAIMEAWYYWRKLTVRECARAQNIPEWFSFSAVSDSQAYKAIGNGWDIEPVKGLLKPLLYI